MKALSLPGRYWAFITISIVLIISLFFIVTHSDALFIGDGPGRSARNHFERGHAAFMKADYKTAREHLAKAVEEYAEYAQAYYALGRVGLAEKKFKQAAAYFKRAIEIDTEFTDAQLALGRLYLAARMPEEALARAAVVLKQDTGNMAAILIKGSALLTQKREGLVVNLLEPLFDEGERERQLIMLLASACFRKGDSAQGHAVLQEGLVAHPEDTSLLLQLANVHLRSGKLAQSQAVMEKVREIDPSNAAYAINLAKLYWESQDIQKAEDTLTNMLAQDPGDVSRRIAGANFYLKRGKIDQAEDLLNEGIAAGDNGAHLRLALGEVYLKTGQAQAAVDMLKAGLESMPAPSENERISLRNALARIYLAAKDVTSAKKHVDVVLDLDPDNIQGVVTSAMAAKAAGQTEQAVSKLKRVLRLQPQYLDGYLQLADAYASHRQVSNARETLKQGLQLAPENQSLLFAAARTCLIEKDYKQAEMYFRSLVEKHPGAIDAQAQLGDLYLALNDANAAQREYSEIVLKSPRSALGYIKLSRLYINQGNLEKALSQLKKGYSLVERNQVLATELAGILTAFRRFDEALALCDARLAREPQEAYAHNLKGKTLMQMNKIEAARKSFQKAVRINPGWPEATNNLAAVHLKQGKTATVTKNLEAALMHNAQNPAAYLTLAKIYEKEKKYDKAIDTYEKGVKNVPRFWAAANNLAFMLCQYYPTQKNLDRALGLALGAYRLKSGRADILDTIAWIQCHQGKYDQAKALLEKINEQVPGNAMYTYHLSMVLHKTGKNKEALALLEPALKSKTVFHGRNEAERTLKELKSTVKRS